MQKAKDLGQPHVIKPLPNRFLLQPTWLEMPKIEDSSSKKEREDKAEGLGLVFYNRKTGPSKVYKFGDADAAPRPRATKPCRTPVPIPVQPSTDNTPPPSAPPAPPAPPTDIANEAFVDTLLEDNYRGLAEEFVRIASRSSGKRSASSPIVPSPAVLPATGITLDSEKPSPQPVQGQSFAASRRILSVRSPLVEGTFSGSNAIVLEPYCERPVVDLRNQSSGDPPLNSPAAYGHRVFSVPKNASASEIEARSRSVSKVTRGQLYFTEEERQLIAALVRAKPRSCHHLNCTDCTDIEFAYHENKAMATSLPPEERQKIINNNRSLRNIKNVGFTSNLLWPLLILI
jgi:hypothetical protein